VSGNDLTPARSTANLTPVHSTATAVAVPPASIGYDFQTDLAAVSRQRFVLWLMIALVAMVGGWLTVAQVDIIVNADGKLATSDSEIVIQPLETSIVRSVPISVGQKVKKDEVLATLDPTFTEADESERATKLRGLQAAYDRQSVESEGKQYAPANPNEDELTQLAVWRKRQAEYTARITSAEHKVQQLQADITAHKTEAEGLTEQIRLASEARGIYATLVASNLASRLKLIETSEHLIQAKSRLSTNQGEQQRLTDQIAEVQSDRDAFVSEWGRKLSEELAKTRSDRDGIAAQLSKAQLRHRMAQLRAPRDATVLEVASRPEGSVVREAEPLVRLVPADAPIVADIRIDTRDVARLRVGDPVTVKFEALPWQQFGFAEGALKSLAPDTLTDENPREAADGMSAPGLKAATGGGIIHYRAQVNLTETKFRNLPPDFGLRPGMRIVANIKIGRRSVLEYILNPVTRVISDSLREP
jgi:membrane fusion protein, hemolysin D